jgi:hypothetical protein
MATLRYRPVLGRFILSEPSMSSVKAEYSICTASTLAILQARRSFVQNDFGLMYLILYSLDVLISYNLVSTRYP